MPKIVDKEKIKILKRKGLSNREVATLLDVAPSTVGNVLRLSETETKSLEEFNRDLPNHLSKVIAKLVKRFHEIPLDNVSPYQLAGMLSLLIEKQRLLSGQSTSNNAILFHLVSQACAPGREENEEGFAPGGTKDTGGS